MSGRRDFVQENADTSRIVDLISFDPGLTARVMQLSNSAFLGGSSPVTDMSEAVNRIGLQNIYLMSEVFTAGLLHHVGLMLMAEAFGNPYAQLFAQYADNPETRAGEERAQFGVDAAEAGAHLLICWNFPEPLVAAVAFHLRPKEAGDAQRTAALVHIADLIARLLEQPPTDEIACSPATEDALNILQLSHEAILRYRDRTRENFETVSALCQP